MNFEAKLRHQKLSWIHETHYQFQNHAISPRTDYCLCIICYNPSVTLASAERSFSKSKLIKTYLRSSISQERLDGLALLAIENEGAKQLNIDDLLLEKFANTKA